MAWLCWYLWSILASQRAFPVPLSIVCVCKRGRVNVSSNYSGASRNGRASSSRASAHHPSPTPLVTHTSQPPDTSRPDLPRACLWNQGGGAKLPPADPPLEVPGYLGFTSSVFVPSLHQGQLLHPYVSGGTKRTKTGREPQLGRKPISDLLLDPTFVPPCLRFQGLGPRISGNQRPCHSIQPPK